MNREVYYGGVTEIPGFGVKSEYLYLIRIRLTMRNGVDAEARLANVPNDVRECGGRVDEQVAS